MPLVGGRVRAALEGRASPRVRPLPCSRAPTLSPRSVSCRPHTALVAGAGSVEGLEVEEGSVRLGPLLVAFLGGGKHALGEAITSVSRTVARGMGHGGKNGGGGQGSEEGYRPPKSLTGVN